MATIIGTNGNNNLSGTSQNDTLLGLGGNDTLLGLEGNDTLIGVNIVSGFGSGEIDTLTGGAGSDTFVLGGIVNGSRTVFYNDGNPFSSGTGDYALITDFRIGQDTIEVAGSGNDYTIGFSPAGLPSGTAIFLSGGGTFAREIVPELIAIVQFDLSSGARLLVSGPDTSLSGSFVFV
ncbi:calcium-binding protein [Iningainema tapete]|uniref:Calcium-binding protein n=1 Tax=Iningainema tapete BLCC-T55 TaxID=2748662 RepID=A0A8J6Y0L5_9CYAN|nr:hypothetical protein [Iningainema tapete]MBD2776908.1 hypothetical protein [Iningainema tapete BLCC-T55]